MTERAGLSVDEALEAVRRAGLVQTADPDRLGTWHTGCPICAVTDAMATPLTITDPGNGRPARLRCSNHCEAIEITERLARELPGRRSAPNGGPELRFASAAELREHTPAEPPWIWGGYLARGALTLLAGKPKSGKSTLALAVAEAVALNGSDLLGRTVNGGPVVYVSEEGSATLAHKLPDGDVRIVTRDLAWPKPEWPTLVAAATAEAERTGAVLLVIDTLAYWAAMPAEREKDAGAAQAVMAPLLAAARNGLSVFTALHQRKGGGEDGEAVRGSTAFAGAADIVLELERTKDDTPSRQRALLALSRYPQTPGALVIDHDPATGGWSVVGEGSDRGDLRAMSDRAAILRALQASEELTRDELQHVVGAPARQWHATLATLIDEGTVTRSGAGKKGDPYHFSMLCSDSAQTAARQPRRNTQREGGLSAALHVVEQQKPHDLEATPNGAPCAERDTAAKASSWTDVELQALVDSETAANSERLAQ